MKKISLLVAVVVSAVALSFTVAVDGNYSVDTSKSSIKWTGYHLAKSYEHYGNVNFESGSFNVKNGAITSGTFVIDMNSITVKDIPADSEDNGKLVGHLKNNDFFAVDEFPKATIKIKSSTKEAGNKLKVVGDLTIRGITEEIEFTADVKNSSDNNFEADAKISFDRTVYKVSYGWTIENAVLSNTVDLDVSIVASK